MRLPGIKTAQNASRWLRARILGGALILGYHRISPTQNDAYGVCVSPENFSEHLEVLRKFTSPIGLAQLAQHLKEGSLPPKSVAVTFDDGYADNLYTARPLLEKFEIPATVFVCTGYAGGEFWWDEVDRRVTASDADLNALSLEVGEHRFQWHQPFGSPDENDLRRQFRDKLYNFLLSLDIDDLWQSMDMIRTWSGSIPGELPVSRAMSHQELLQLSSGGLIEIGAHTRYHLMLPRIHLERQRDEIVSVKQELEALLDRPVRGFAYPNGRSTEDTRRIVRDVGFDYACTSLHDVVRPGSDLYELTRFWQEDVGGDKFISRVSLWMNSR